MKIREIDIPDTRPFIVKASEYKPSKDFNPPKTLGRPRGKTAESKRVMAMDACIKNVLSGFRDELYSCGTPMFAGYGLLSSISQEALIRAGVDTIADEMTRKFVKFRYDVDDGREDHEKELSELEQEAEKYKIKDRFNEAAQKDGYFGGCLGYIDVGELDEEEAEEPLILDTKTFKKGMFKGLKIIEPVNIYPGQYNTTDPTDEHYFNPEYWYVLGKRYHASRFIYFASNEVPLLLKPAYNFFGIARSQLALDYIAHFVENRESAQELLNKFSLTCWKTDMSQVLAGESCNDLVKRVRMFNKMKSNNGTLVVDKEQEDIMQINTPLSGVRDIVEMSLNLLTAVWRIPKIKYIGEGEGGLNASSKEQMRSFYDFILSQKEKMFTQPMETVLKILQLNMGKEVNPAIGFEFPSLVEMDDSEIASLNKMKADTAVSLINAGVVSQEEVRQNLSMDKHSGFSMIDVDDVPEQPEEPEKEIVDVEDADLTMDDRWITIGHKDADEDGEEHKGRHILLKNGETPVEAIERTIKKDIDGNGSVGNSSKTNEKESGGKEQPKEENKKEDGQKSDTDGHKESKTEEKKEEPKSENKEKTTEELEKEWTELQLEQNELRRRVSEDFEKIKSGSKELADIQSKLDAEYKKETGSVDWEKVEELKKQRAEEQKRLADKYKEENPDLVKQDNDLSEKIAEARKKYEESEQKDRQKKEEEKRQKHIEELNAFAKEYNNFKDSHTVEEANAYARIICASGGSFSKNTNVKTANTMNKTLMGLMLKYDSLKKLNTFGTGSRMGSAIMHANDALIEIKDSYGEMSEEKIKDYFEKYGKTRDQKQKEYDELLKNKAVDLAKGVDPNLVEARLINAKPRSRYRVWSVQTTPENFIRDTLYHEFGHTLMFRKMKEELGVDGSWYSYMGSYKKALNSTNVAKSINKALRQARKTGDIYEISEYADTNYHEFFAEVFAMRESGQKLPDYIETMLKEVCGK